MRRFAGYRSGEERPVNRGGPFKAKAAQKVKSRAGGKQPAGPRKDSVEQTILFDDARSSEAKGSADGRLSIAQSR